MTSQQQQNKPYFEQYNFAGPSFGHFHFKILKYVNISKVSFHFVRFFSLDHISFCGSVGHSCDEHPAR